MANAAPRCECHVPAVKLPVRKESPNKGRLFYGCGKNQQCHFFKWASDLPEGPSSFFSQGSSSHSTTPSQSPSSAKRRATTPDEWDNDGMDEVLSQIPDHVLSPNQAKGPVKRLFLEQDDDPILPGDPSPPFKKPKPDVFATPPRLGKHPSPAKTPATPIDEVAGPAMDLLEALKKQVTRLARVQVAKQKQAEFKDGGLREANAKVEALEARVATLQARVHALEEENAALKGI